LVHSVEEDETGGGGENKERSWERRGSWGVHIRGGGLGREKDPRPIFWTSALAKG